ncbi:nitrogenase component 1 [Lachnospiraceae bacterium 54-53]
MGLYQCRPPMSGRMGTLWTLAPIRDAALIEYGCMGHMMYGRVFLNRAGVVRGCRLYSTHLNETDISLGDMKPLHRTLKQILEQDKVKTVFLLPSSVPTVTGTDLEAVSRELNLKYPDLRLIAFGAGGFDVHGSKGVEETLLRLAKTIPREVSPRKHPSFNLIGSCADMFRFHADAAELVRILKGAFGMNPACIMTSDTSVRQMENMAGAHINLVIRREGAAAAGYLEKTYGIPSLYRRPYGIRGTVRWIESIAEICKIKINREFVKQEQLAAREQIAPSMQTFRHIARMHPEHARLSLGGHPDVVRGILDFGMEEFSFSRGECWSTVPEAGEEEIPFYTEGEWLNAVRNHKQGFLMASGEALHLAGRSRDMQISNPDMKWRLHPYEPPLAGFRGAVQLANLWVNEEQMLH